MHSADWTDEELRSINPRVKSTVGRQLAPEERMACATSAEGTSTGMGDDRGGSRTTDCELGYALGGGSSGGSFIEGGVSTLPAATEDGIVVGVPSRSVIEASAIGAQGAIDWQPSGAQGNSHGAWWCSDSSPDCFCGMPIPGISGSVALPDMPIAAISVLASIAVMSHAKPLPTHARCARRRLMTSAVIRRRRGIAVT